MSIILGTAAGLAGDQRAETKTAFIYYLTITNPTSIGYLSILERYYSRLLLFVARTLNKSCFGISCELALIANLR